MYFIWIFLVQIDSIESIDQAKLCRVLETCIIVELLPLTINLITASLSSNTYNRTSWSFERTRSTSFKTLNVPQDWCPGSRLVSKPTTGYPVLSWVCICVSKELKQSDPMNRKRESGPISIQRPKKWFRILLNCVKLKCVSNISNFKKHMYDFPKKYNVPPQIDRNPQNLQQNRSLETVPVCIVLRVVHHITILIVFTCVMNVWHQSIHAFVRDFGAFCNRSCKLVYWP